MSRSTAASSWRAKARKRNQHTASSGRVETNLTLQAYEVIKQRILRLEIRPGALFSETQLASELATSKTPVREALGLLRREGLVDVAPRSGYRASPITLASVRDLFAVRLLLEVEAAGLAASRSEDSSSLLWFENLCQASYDQTDPNSISRFLRANTQLHASIARVGGNELLTHIIERVLERMERLFHLGLSLSSRSEEIIHEHRDLLHAILTRNVNLARQTAREQIQASQDMVMAALLSSAAVQTVSITDGSIP